MQVGLHSMLLTSCTCFLQTSYTQNSATSFQLLDSSTLFGSCLYFLTLCLKLLVTAYSVHSFFSWVLGSFLQSLLRTLSQVGCLSSPHLVVLPGFCLVPLSGTCSFAISFCLNFYAYFYICSMLVTFLMKKWPSVGDVLCASAVHSLLITQRPGTSSSRGRFWPVCGFSFTGCRGIVFLLLGSAPWWVRLVEARVKAIWWEGWCLPVGRWSWALSL